MATTFEIQIIKKSRVIGSCLYYDYTSLEVLKEVERIVNNYNSNLVGKDSDLNIFAFSFPSRRIILLICSSGDTLKKMWRS